MARYGWSLLLGLLCLLPMTAQAAETHVDYLFAENAGLAGRALACGDRAGHAGLRSVSKGLLPMLSQPLDAEAGMQEFDRRARTQMRLARRASGKRQVCERIQDELFRQLDRTRLIMTPLMPAPSGQLEPQP